MSEGHGYGPGSIGASQSPYEATGVGAETEAVQVIGGGVGEGLVGEGDFDGYGSLSSDEELEGRSIEETQSCIGVYRMKAKRIMQ